MLNAIVKEYEVHGRVISIIELKTLVESWNQSVYLAKLDVLSVCIFIVTKKNIFKVLKLPIHVEVAFHTFMEHFAVFVSIVLVD
jgi:hypothetical protein